MRPGASVAVPFAGANGAIVAVPFATGVMGASVAVPFAAGAIGANVAVPFAAGAIEAVPFLSTHRVAAPFFLTTLFDNMEGDEIPRAPVPGAAIEGEPVRDDIGMAVFMFIIVAAALGFLVASKPWSTPIIVWYVGARAGTFDVGGGCRI